jgi:hypothetical protein
LQHFGSLPILARASVQELLPFLSRTKALRLISSLRMSAVVLREERESLSIDSPLAIAELCSEMRFLDRESLRVVLLNAKQHLIKVERGAMCSVTVRTCTGDVLSSLVDPFAGRPIGTTSTSPTIISGARTNASRRAGSDLSGFRPPSLAYNFSIWCSQPFIFRTTVRVTHKEAKWLPAPKSLSI